MNQEKLSSDSPSFCSQFCQQLRCCQSQPWFDVSAFDVERTFAPRDTVSIVVKAVVTIVTIGTFIYAWTLSLYPPLLMGFLTQWAYATLCIYTLVSLYHSVMGVRQSTTTTATLLVRVQWVTFELGLHMTVLACFGFYVFLLDPSVLDYVNIAQHGGIVPLILIDGLVVNRIPFHMRHYFGIVIPVELLYVLWTYIHSLTDIGNPGNPAGDALYPGALEWTSELWQMTAILGVLMVFVLGPIAYILFWCLSNGVCCCRDVVRRKTGDVEERNDVETGENDEHDF